MIDLNLYSSSEGKRGICDYPINLVLCPFDRREKTYLMETTCQPREDFSKHHESLVPKFAHSKGLC